MKASIESVPPGDGGRRASAGDGCTGRGRRVRALCTDVVRARVMRMLALGQRLSTLPRAAVVDDGSDAGAGGGERRQAAAGDASTRRRRRAGAVCAGAVAVCTVERRSSGFRPAMQRAVPLKRTPRSRVQPLSITILMTVPLNLLE